MQKRHATVLFYHKIRPRSAPLFGEAIAPSHFEKQIIWLKKYYEIVDLANLKDVNIAAQYKKDIVAITFDDGYRDNFLYALPTLKKHKVPATFFLTAGYIDTKYLLWHDEIALILYNASSWADSQMLAKYGLPKSIIGDLLLFFQSNHRQRVKLLRSIAREFKRFTAEERVYLISNLAKIYNVCIQAINSDRVMLSWDEIREMDKYNISFGSHTVTHPVLSSIYKNDVLQEISESKKIIEEKIQKPVTTFAYPYGKEEDYNDEVIRILKDNGFEICCTTIPGSESLPLQNPFTLKRKGVPPSPYLFI